MKLHSPAQIAIVILLASLGPVPQLHAGTVTFSDGTLADANWTSTVVQQDPGITFSDSQVLSGGNPTAYRQFTGTYSGLSFPAIEATVELRQGAVFNPATHGGITSLTWSEDLGSFDNTVFDVFSTATAILQNGSFYRAGGYGLQDAPQGWYPISTQIYSAASFFLISGPGPSQPDFSVSGSPMQFGYWEHVYLGDNGTKIGGVDNWSMSVSFVPEPSSLVLAGCGIAGLAICARRRRRMVPRSAIPAMRLTQ